MTCGTTALLPPLRLLLIITKTLMITETGSTRQGRYSSALGVFCLVSLMLLSQYVGWIHNLAHSPNSQVKSIGSSVSQDWSMRSLADSHFSYIDSAAENSETVSVSCKLFDALMLGVCLASIGLVVALLEFGFDTKRLSRIFSINVLPLWAYLSRAPPI